MRIDPQLYESLAKWAQRERRSANGQIEFLLREAVEDWHDKNAHEEANGQIGKRAPEPE